MNSNLGVIGYITAIFGMEFDNKLYSSDAKRKLPPSIQGFQASSSSSRPNVPVKGVGSSQSRETYGRSYANLQQNHAKTHIGEHSSRANNDSMRENHHVGRVLPQTMISPMSGPNAQYGNPSDHYHPSGVVDEQAIGDERHIYQVALQVLISSSR